MTSINSAVNINWYEFVFDSNDMQHKMLSGKIESEEFLVIMELFPRHVLMLEEEKILVI